MYCFYQVCIYIYFFDHPVYIYRVIKKSLCTWWLQYRKLQVMFKVSPASLQTFVETPNYVLEDRVQYSTVHIPNVFCDGHLQLINCVEIVRIHWVCTVIVRCAETFWSPFIFARIYRDFNLQRKSDAQPDLRPYISAYYIYIYIYTGWFMTCGHYCRRWSPRYLW